MLAVFVTEPGRVKWTDRLTPRPGPSEVHVKTEAACLCSTADAKTIAGQFPSLDACPTMLSHEADGFVVAVGEKVRNVHVGDRVIGGLLFNAGDGRTASGWNEFWQPDNPSPESTCLNCPPNTRGFFP